ncbi:MAG: LPXTG cell wall anchor domain-containing protein [Oscillospiraceae bacterium]|nr:LPXTG cell wall anchor domain-containing protein [Oscillospiraceae bacterium]
MKLIELAASILPQGIYLQTASAVPSTGNTESSTYIIIIAVAGVLLVGAAVAGIFTKKKK